MPSACSRKRSTRSRNPVRSARRPRRPRRRAGNIAAYERAMGTSFPEKAVDVLIGAFDGIDCTAA